MASPSSVSLSLVATTWLPKRNKAEKMQSRATQVTILSSGRLDECKDEATTRSGFSNSQVREAASFPIGKHVFAFGDEPRTNEFGTRDFISVLDRGQERARAT